MTKQPERVKKNCKLCGRIFLTRSKTRKYCSKKCRIEGVANNCDTKGQICWMCQNSTGKCSWSRELKPVEGWEAEPTIIRNKDGDIYDSYKITYCPQFINDCTFKEILYDKK